MNMTMNEKDTLSKGFHIRHLSHRTKTSFDSYGNAIKFIILNIVFEAHNENLKDTLNQSLENFKKYNFCLDKEKLENYYKEKFENYFYSDNDTKEKLKKPQDFWVEGYTFNQDVLCDNIHYIEKFDVYQFHSYLQDNPLVRGAIQYLEDMKQGEKNISRFEEWSIFESILNTLVFWWD